MAKHRMRRPVNEQHPIVYYAGGWWLRSGHTNRYDAWPVLAELTDYQRKLIKA